MTEQQDQLQDKRRQDFFIIDNAVIDDYNLTPFEFTVYAIIVRRAYNKTTAWPGMANIAKWGSMSKSTVIRAVNGLEEKGLLQVKRGKKEDGQNAANIYTIMETSRPQTPGSVRETLGVVSEIDQKNTEDKKTKEEDSNTTPPAKAADGEAGASKNGNALSQVPPGDWQPANVFEFVLEKLYAVQYNPVNKISRSTRGHVNTIRACLKDIDATVEELAAAWTAYPEHLSKPRGGPSWAGMVIEFRKNGAGAVPVPEFD